MIYIVAFLCSLAFAWLGMPLARKLATRFKMLDNPAEATRKIHRTLIPRAGGLIVWPTFMLFSIIFLSHLGSAYWGLVASGTIVFLVGLADDVWRLSPSLKLVFQILAALVAAVGFGIGVNVISNPAGSTLHLGGPTLLAFGRTLTLGSLLFTVFWLVGMTNTINFLDGIDGLAGGVSAIAAFILFLVSLLPRINQPETALMAIILCGACLGFLRHNFFPAKLFLGDGGAYFLGMVLGGLAIISGAKLATALLVLGVPVLDTAWAIIRRLAGRRSPFSADRGHVHYLLLDYGFSQRQVVGVIYSLALIFGLVALIGNSLQKLLALVVLAALVALGIVILTLRTKAGKLHRRKNTPVSD